MTDLHTHILPGMDDGAADGSEAEAILRMEAEDGVTQIALTPHFDPEEDDISGFLLNREKAFQRLMQCPSAEKFRFALGAEVRFQPQLARWPDEKLLPFCIGDTKVILLELPSAGKPPFAAETFRALVVRDYIPVLAHVERFPYLLEHPETLHEWIRIGVYTQSNAGATLRKSSIRRALRKRMRQGLIHVVATDTHSAQHRRPCLGEAMTVLGRRLGRGAVAALNTRADALFRGIAPD